MKSYLNLSFLILLCLISLQIHASRCGEQPNRACQSDCYRDKCCQNMGGIQYCDASSGRYVCQNGFFSSCYCTRHAVMDLEHLQGCCLWQGGVLDVNESGLVICNNGGVSEICTLDTPMPSRSSW
ncbi:MAG: neurogenic locus notch [Legionellaceae bacterium]|nr:neurogenic locus notch [Legionellaceae bacterium]HCA89094.1 neurogenic locus notch [Legionellales bacterium]|tara:strand:- start:488 stop:862 length:375 start_codon:yes stop_codon:yes gene_type:complete